jgi:uncharacterized protein (TIGR02099 family)
MTSLAQWLRRLRTLCWTAFSIVVIAAAILVGVAKLLMPYSDRYQPQLESWLSSEFGYPVSVESFSGQWRAFGPRLTLKGLRIHSVSSSPGSDDMLISQAALDLKPLSLLWPGQAFYSFLVIGADLQLVRDVDGKLHLSGLGLSSDAGSGSGTGIRTGKPSGLGRLVGVGELRLENSRLDVLDEKLAAHLHFSALNGLLQLSDDQLAIKLESSLTVPTDGRVYGGVDAIVKARLDVTGGLQQASWQLTISDLLLVHLYEQMPGHPLLPRQGKLAAQIRGDWAKGDAQDDEQDETLSSQGSVEILNTWLSNGRSDLLLDQLSSNFSLQLTHAENWRLDLHDLNIQQGEMHAQVPGLVLARNLADDLGWWFGADYLALQDVLPVARELLAVLDLPWPESLPQQISGSLADFDLMLDSQSRHRWLSGEFRDLAVREWPKRPSLSGLNGNIRLLAGEGKLNLNAPALQVDWPEIFGYPLQFSLPECQAELVLGPAWQLALHSCRLFNNDVSAQGDVRIVASPGRPAVDVNVEILRLDATQLNPYWPQGIMPERVTSWLRSNLHEGQVSSGRVQIFGDMDDWPFRHGEGRFEARAQIENGVLSFVPGWPKLQQLTATAEFIGGGMRVEGQAADFAGVPVAAAEARIENFGQPRLMVEFSGQDQVGKVLNLLQQTPILPARDVDLSRFSFTGVVAAQGVLDIPLGRTPGELRLDGNARLSKGGFVDLASEVQLDNVAGQLNFDQRHLWAEDLAASYKSKPASLDLQAGGDDQWGLQARLKGDFSVLDLLPGFLLQQQDFVKHINGSSEWQAEVLVPARAAGPDQQVLLRVESGLQGVGIDLPAPLLKKDYEIWPLALRYPLTGDSRLLQLELNQEFSLAAELSSSSTVADAPPEMIRAVVELGRAQPELPAAGRVQVGGSASRLDLDAWVELVIDNSRGGNKLAGLQLDGFAVQADELIFLDRLFTGTELQVELANNTIRADFSGADIDGHLLFTLATTGRNSLNAEFERLALGKPLSSGLDTDSNPADLPELHLYAQSFRYAGLEMGETRIEAYPTGSGFHFEKVEANSAELSVRASGDWSLQEQGQRSEFDIMMTAESLGDLLQSLDISSSMVGGQTVLEFDAWWPGSPAAFALARLNGAIEFSVTRGQITNANTGTGKVLGLLSIQSLPRRLALDFRDVFDSGFLFETASGTFQMENGTASTDDVKLSSSAANISLSGSTDLVKKLYDQQMTVMPGVGNTLPVIGAIAAGPGGAAAGLALQGLLHEQLGKATQVQYSITGTWDEPVIEPIIKGNGKPDSEGAGPTSATETD